LYCFHIVATTASGAFIGPEKNKIFASFDRILQDNSKYTKYFSALFDSIACQFEPWR